VSEARNGCRYYGYIPTTKLAHSARRSNSSASVFSLKKNRNKKFDSLDSKSLASSIDEMSQLLDELSVGGGSAGERLATDITDII